MAATSASIHTSFERMKTVNGQKRRQELEEEVARLHKMLQDEEKVHEILKRALELNGTPSSVHIPSFLPKKAKELFAELFMLEEEIARLEGEITKIQQSVIIAEESRAQVSKKFSMYHEKVASSNHPSITPMQIPISNVFEEKVAFEAKPMFFINQAIKGAYSNHGFASNGNSLETASRKGRQRLEINVERIPRKSEKIESQPSPKMPPRHSSPRQSNSNMEILHKLLHEPTLSTSSLDKNGQEWHPNKLSEKILKCLICIFMRLMRTSRVIELEKSSNISRYNNNSISRTRSFRMESGLNLNSSLNMHKEARKNDPYGIFETEDSLLRDIGPYKNLVMFTSSSLELKGISSCLPLLNNLRKLLSNLHEVNLKPLSHLQKLAFWINVHNICLMHGFLEHGLPSNPENIIGLRNKAVLNIGGQKLNSLKIEHLILRQASNTREDCEEDAIRIIYGLGQVEPNLHFALCFGHRSSPAVKIYRADSVSAELEKSKLEYLQASIVVTASRRVMIPKLVFSNMTDGVSGLESVVEWICNQLPSSGTLRKSISECIRGQRTGKMSEIVDILPYEFDFQYLLPV